MRNYVDKMQLLFYDAVSTSLRRGYESLQMGDGTKALVLSTLERMVEQRCNETDPSGVIRRLLDTPVSDESFELDSRPRNSIVREYGNILIRALVGYHEEDLLKIRRFSQVGLNQVNVALESQGLHLAKHEEVGDRPNDLPYLCGPMLTMLRRYFESAEPSKRGEILDEIELLMLTGSDEFDYQTGRHSLSASRLRPVQLVLDVLSYPAHDELDLTKRARQGLEQYEGTITVRQLISLDEEDLLELDGLGSVSQKEIKVKLRELGLCLGMRLERPPNRKRNRIEMPYGDNFLDASFSSLRDFLETHAEAAGKIKDVINEIRDIRWEEPVCDFNDGVLRDELALLYIFYLTGDKIKILDRMEDVARQNLGSYLELCQSNPILIIDDSLKEFLSGPLSQLGLGDDILSKIASIPYVGSSITNVGDLLDKRAYIRAYKQFDPRTRKRIKDSLERLGLRLSDLRVKW